MSFGTVKFSLAVLPVLLASTSVLAADIGAAPLKQSGLVVGGGAGADLFWLPTAPANVFGTAPSSASNGNSAPLVGGGISAGIGMPIGDPSDLNLLLGIGGFVDFAQGSSSVTQTFSGPGTVVIPGYTTPTTGTIALSATPGAASSHVDGVAPLIANDVDSVGVGVDQWGVQTNAPDSFDFAALTVSPNGTNPSAAYGAIATTAGGIFLATGDLTGLSVTTSTSSSLIYAGMDATITATGKEQQGTVFQAYVGPSYRYLNNQTTTTTSVTVPAVNPTDPSNFFPVYSMSDDEQVSSHYFGGIVGLNAVQRLSDSLSLAWNVQGGLYDAQSSLTGTESYNIVGGTGGRGSLVTVPSTTVANANGASQSANGLAYSAQLGATLTMPVNSGLDVSFGGSAEYLSRVAYAARGNTISSASSYNGATDATTGNTTLGFGGMWNLGVTAGLTGHF